MTYDTTVTRARCQGCTFTRTLPRSESMLPELRKHRAECSHPILLWSEPMLDDLELSANQLTLW